MEESRTDRGEVMTPDDGLRHRIIERQRDVIDVIDGRPSRVTPTTSDEDDRHHYKGSNSAEPVNTRA